MNSIKNRIGLFLMRDLKGEVHKYIEYLLADITSNLDRLIIICNGILKDEEKEKLLKFSDEVIVRADIGFDFGGWRDCIINYLGFETIREFDELVLFNDSFFGPLYPFSLVFQAIDDRYDFWGLSVHSETSNVYGMCPYGYRPQYLQTYFLAIRRKMLLSEAFEKFWEFLPVQDSFRAVGEKISCVFTKYFEDRGFKWRAYCDTSDLDTTREKAMSYHTYNLYDMVVRRGFPIIKRKALAVSKTNSLRYGFANDVSRTMEYLRNDTSYPSEYIYEYLLKRYNLFDLKNSFNWNCVLDTEKSNLKNFNKRIAVVAHLFYPELFDYAIHYIRNIPAGIDVIITTSTNEKKGELEEKLKECQMERCEVRIVQARGRDLSAFLVGCRDVIRNYDYVCFVHDKKSSQKEFVTVGSQFSDILWESMLKSEAYIKNIISRFEENSRLGMLVPLNVYHGTYFNSSIDYWTICYEKVLEVAEEIEVDTKIEAEKPPISVGTVFWIKTDAMKNLLLKNWSYEDFPGEPLPGDGSISHALERIFPFVAQHNGYYTETVMPTDIAAAEITNLRFMWSDTVQNLVGMRGILFNTHNAFISSINNLREDIKRIEEYSTPEKEVVLVEIGLKRALQNYLKKLFKGGKQR